MSLSFGSDTSRATIRNFSSSTYSAKKGERFILSWEVEGAEKIQLYRNGVPFQSLPPEQKAIERTEFYDSQNDVIYELYAYSNGGQVKSRPVKISFQAPAGELMHPEAARHLLESASWAKFIAIAGLVFLGLAVLSGIALAMNEDHEDILIWLGVIITLLVLVELGPLVMLLRFANKTKEGLVQSSSASLNLSFRYMKLFFQIIGVTIILLLITTIILLLIY